MDYVISDLRQQSTVSANRSHSIRLVAQISVIFCKLDVAFCLRAVILILLHFCFQRMDV